MKCVEAQGLITKYINGELSGEVLEEFLAHIYGCDDCREEFEIYYVIMKGMKQIDEDNVINYNFHEAFEKQLEKSKKDMELNSTGYLFKIIILDIIILLVALLLCGDSSYKGDVSNKAISIFNGISID